MGYYTNYHLYVETSDRKEDDRFTEYLETNPLTSGYELASFYYDKSNSCKWYDHHKDMIELSKKFPTLLFHLEGDGEEQGDQWKKYYKNGKSQICKAKITFELFDEKKLK